MLKTLTIDARKITHSGIGRYLRNLLPGLLPRLQVDRILLVGTEVDLRAIAHGDPRCSVVPSTAEPHSVAEQALAWTPALRHTDLLWVPHYNIPLLYRGPLVTTLHDLAPIDLPEILDSALKRRVAGVLLRQSARRSTAVLTPSEFSRGRIVERLHVPESRIHVTTLAVDPAWPSLDSAPEPFASAEPFLLFVGNLKPNKNLMGLLRALRLLGDRVPHKLLIAGKIEGFRTGDSDAAAEAASLGERVRFLGPVDDALLISLYRGASALVMPSLYEGFGLPVLEAMRYGCPVVTSDGTSLPEIAGDAAVLVDPRDAAAIAQGIRYALDPAHAARLKRAGYDRELRFTYDRAIDTTAAVLNTSMASKVREA